MNIYCYYYITVSLVGPPPLYKYMYEEENF